MNCSNQRLFGRRNCRIGLLACAVLAGMLCPASHAQSVYGEIHGTVRDASGEPLGGAAVTATSEEKGTKFHTRTDPLGHYEFPQLLPDTYDVGVQAQDRKVSTTDISVSADAESLVDLTLPASGQTRNVVGGSSLSTRTDNSITLDRNAIANLPNYDQNSTRFGFLAPGTQLRGTNTVSAQDPQNSLQLTMNGEQPSATAVVLDGTDNRDSINQLAVLNPSLDSLAEIRIVTQSFDAETGQSLSGVVIARTRSGGNAWHGDAFEFRRTSWAEASNPNLQNPSLAVSPQFKINLFGGSLGGPIRRNHLFVFGDYEGIRRSLGSTQVLNVPSQKVRDTCLPPATGPCDLSEYLVSSKSQIYDPTNGSAFGCGGTCIPISRISPQAASLLSLLPAPNYGGANAYVSNYQVSEAEAWDSDAYDIRVDESANTKLSLFGRYSFARYDVHGPSAFGNLVGGKGFGPDGFAGQVNSPNHNLSAGFDYVVRPGLFTDFRFGFFRRKISALPNSYNTTPASNANIPGLNLDVLSSGMPSITMQQPTLQVVSSNIVYGDGQQINQCNCPLFETLQQFQWVNNWVQTRGNHVFKWGEDFRLAEDTSLLSPSRRPGVFTFAQKDTASPPPAGAGGLGLATFLLGDVSTFSRSLGDATDAGIHEKRLFFYGQDTWRLTPRFTLSYGLRWEIYFPQSASGTNLGGFLNLNTGMIQVAGSGGVDLTGNAETDWRNFAPRVGFAYQVDDKTVLRAAYGRNFDALNIFARDVTLNPPVLITQSVPATASTGVCQSCAFQFSGGVPSPPTFPTSGAFDLPAQVSANVVPPQVKAPTLDQWNLTVQRGLRSDLSFELSYLGNKATHILPAGVGGAGQAINRNQPNIVGYAADGCATNPQSAACLGRYPYYNPAFTDTQKPRQWTQPIIYFGGVASANYNAFQGKLVKRFSNGYEFNANYTWAKGIGYQSDYYVQDPRLSRGVNSFDRRHTFNFYNVLEMPFGRGRRFLGNVSHPADYLVGGWSLNTITTWASGLPFSPTYAPTECTQDRDTGPCRPNLVGPVQIGGDRNNYFTTTAGQKLSEGPTDGSTPGGTIGPWQRPAVGSFGSAGFNSFRGPAYFDTDLVLEKTALITERYSVQFRTEFLNVFNKVNLGNPNGCVDCFVTKGVQTGAVITTLAPNAAQRQIEFALRFLF
jgi:hypothetical protein